MEGLLTSVNAHRAAYCTSCYTGKYPVPFPRDEGTHVQLTLRVVPERQDN